MTLAAVLLLVCAAALLLVLLRCFPRTCLAFLVASATWLLCCVVLGIERDAAVLLLLLGALVFWKAAFWCWVIGRIARLLAGRRRPV